MAEKTFTEALESLQKAASELGKQATTLEESLKLFEQGIKEAEFCEKILSEAEQKIETYTEG
jgi:exodeoxyribonuclease VII small subunit